MILLKAARQRRGWTQTDAAYHARLAQADISKFERRQRVPGPQQAERLARALGVPIARLLDEVVTSDPEAHRG